MKFEFINKIKYNDKLLIDMSDKEFEDYLNYCDIEVVSSEGGWSNESKEDIIKTMKKLIDDIFIDAFEKAKNTQDEEENPQE
jgi:predicted SAM-dependent methyltransferase